MIMKIFIRITLALLLGGAVFPLLVIVKSYSDVYHVLKQEIRYNPDLPARIYDIRGRLISQIYTERRSFCRLDDMSPYVKAAFITAEDRAFYEHSGYSLFSILRAAVVDVMQGGIRQGGSTITQQLAKQLYTGGTRTISRKLSELFIARELERRLSKERILEMYLNLIYFGHGAYGVKSAAHFFFGEDIGSLKPAEASLLSVIPSAPNRNSPLRDPESAFRRALNVLRVMAENGAMSPEILESESVRLKSEIIPALLFRPPSETVRHSQVDHAPFFTEYVRKILVDNYGENIVYRRGLDVHTTLDIDLQKSAEKRIKEMLGERIHSAYSYNMRRRGVFEREYALDLTRRKSPGKADSSLSSNMVSIHSGSALDAALVISELFGAERASEAVEASMERYDRVLDQSRLEAAFIAIDSSGGGIRAMVGGADMADGGQLNRAVQAYRQPGSAFKAFVYGAGIESGAITAATRFQDLPMVFKQGSKTWEPSNYGRDFSGSVLARKAVAASLNTVAVLALEKAGPKTVASFASRLTGAPKSRFELDGTLALGTSELSPLELAKGFAVFANGGRAVSPHTVVKIADRSGNVYFEKKAVSDKKVISPETAYIVNDMLRDVVDRGTATAAIRRRAGLRLPASGKTGTNTGYRDAWFAGSIPGLTAVVWFGCNSQRFSLGPGASASVIAAPVWGRIMRDASSVMSQRSFPARPAGVSTVTVCPLTGKRASSGCGGATEFFRHGTEPDEVCSGEHSDILNPLSGWKKAADKLKDRELKKIERKLYPEDEGWEIVEHSFE